MKDAIKIVEGRQMHKYRTSSSSSSCSGSCPLILSPLVSVGRGDIPLIITEYHNQRRPGRGHIVHNNNVVSEMPSFTVPPMRAERPLHDFTTLLDFEFAPTFNTDLVYTPNVVPEELEELLLPANVSMRAESPWHDLSTLLDLEFAPTFDTDIVYTPNVVPEEPWDLLLPADIERN
jgi:hypothetical protein